MTGSRSRYVWGSTMKYLINEGYDEAKVVEADFYDYQNDGKFITFWKETPKRNLAVLTLSAAAVYTVEAQPG